MQRALILSVVLVILAGGRIAAQCTPTPGAILDPGYTPAAPKRDNVGAGFVLTGTVIGDDDCKPLPGATVEFWLSGHQGYTDDLFGTAVADRNGRYRIQTPFPVSSDGGPPPHIHMNIAADGFVAIRTEVFPKQGTTSAVFDIVLDLGD